MGDGLCRFSGMMIIARHFNAGSNSPPVLIASRARRAELLIVLIRGLKSTAIIVPPLRGSGHLWMNKPERYKIQVVYSNSSLRGCLKSQFWSAGAKLQLLLVPSRAGRKARLLGLAPVQPGSTGRRRKRGLRTPSKCHPF